MEALALFEAGLDPDAGGGHQRLFGEGQSSLDVEVVNLGLVERVLGDELIFFELGQELVVVRLLDRFVEDESSGQGLAAFVDLDDATFEDLQVVLELGLSRGPDVTHNVAPDGEQVVARTQVSKLIEERTLHLRSGNAKTSRTRGRAVVVGVALAMATSGIASRDRLAARLTTDETAKWKVWPSSILWNGGRAFPIKRGLSLEPGPAVDDWLPVARAIDSPLRDDEAAAIDLPAKHLAKSRGCEAPSTSGGEPLRRKMSTDFGEAVVSRGHLESFANHRCDVWVDLDGLVPFGVPDVVIAVGRFPDPATPIGGGFHATQDSLRALVVVELGKRRQDATQEAPHATVIDVLLG